jgi:hypothetical protein
MCHHYEGREWAALREELEEAEPDGVEGEAPEVEAVAEPETADRLPSIQPSD